MLTVQTDPVRGVVELTLDGPASRPEYDAAVTEMNGAIDHFGKLLIVEVIKDIGWIDSSIWWQDIKWAVRHVKDVARCAVVSDKGWVGPITRAASALVSAEVRVFPLAELDAARLWVRERG